MFILCSLVHIIIVDLYSRLYFLVLQTNHLCFVFCFLIQILPRLLLRFLSLLDFCFHICGTPFCIVWQCMSNCKVSLFPPFLVLFNMLKLQLKLHCFIWYPLAFIKDEVVSLLFPFIFPPFLKKGTLESAFQKSPFFVSKPFLKRWFSDLIHRMHNGAPYLPKKSV